MKRRDFLKSVSALAASTAVSAPVRVLASQGAIAPGNAADRLGKLSQQSRHSRRRHQRYDRLISHEMKTGPNGQPYYDKDKFKPELAEDMNVGDMSVTFKLKKKATFQDGESRPRT